MHSWRLWVDAVNRNKLININYITYKLTLTFLPEISCLGSVTLNMNLQKQSEDNS